MRRVLRLLAFLAAASPIAFAVHVYAYPQAARTTKAACASCHANPAGGAELTAAGTAFKADPAKAPEAGQPVAYAGTEKCKMCHMKQYKAWQSTKHAGALAALKAAPDTVVAAVAAKLGVKLEGAAASADGCVGCHVTGFQLPGGYPAADSAKTAAVAMVGCEACHGPGSKHVTAPMADKKKLINKAVGANLCMQCHTPVMSPGFKFEEKKKSVHAVPAG
jgi:hypothetical protein